MAIKFDLFDNSGEGVDSTGIFTDGRSPTLRQPGLAPGFPDTSVDLTGTGIDLHSGHPFTVTLTSDGTTLTETIQDTVTNARFTTTYDVNVAGLVGSDVGYMGFTGGTGGLTAVQDVLSWTVQTTISGRPIGDSPDGGGGVSPAPGNGSGLGGANSALAGAAMLGQPTGTGGPARSLSGPTAAVGLAGGSPAPLGTAAGAGAGAGQAQAASRLHPGVDVGALDQVFSSPDLWEALPAVPR
jgi:hypothetical protein